MPVLNLTIGAVNITNYLIIVVAKSASPNVEETREVFAPEVLNTSFNVSITVADAAVYKVSSYESSDGSTLGQLLGSATWDAKNKVPISETLFYLVNGSRDVDPAEGQGILADPYLDGKNITKVVKDVVSLVPPAYDFKQFNLHTGGGIELIAPLVFNDSEIISVEVTYQYAFETNTSNAGMYDDVVLITANTTLSNIHRNKRLKCESSGSTLTITLEALSAVPAGKFIYFNSNGGSQKKTKIVPSGSDKINYQGNLLTEISFGIGEYLRLEKYSTYWEVIDPHPGLFMVGEWVEKGSTSVINAIAADARYVDGNVEPRLYQYVNSISSTNKIITSADLSGSYTHPAGLEGKFAINTTLKQLRMPNALGWYKKSVDSLSDPVGITQQGQVGTHSHTVSGVKKNDSAGGNQANTLYNGTDNGATATSFSTDATGDGIGATNEVGHIKLVYLIRS